MNTAAVVQTALPMAGSEITLFSMFWHAHIVVKLVMIGLVAASIWCWAIIIDKSLMFGRYARSMDKFEEAFWSGRSLEELYRSLEDKPVHGMQALFQAAMREWKRSFDGQRRAVGSLQQRIDRALDLAIQREGERLQSRIGVLATVGTSAPFIGLFGTVWGIMTSFRSIAASNNTSLAVVAPGIAEALFATAIGLVAAIPAVIAYNKLQSESLRIQGRLEGFADEFSSILSRQLDERAAA
ncbi:protein TolQ [Pseudochelatococcus contaminans]|uniref:Tol-Pal system protein TolQ n=1 Tax=Pseudochelatococcus contaminans TaxID=1538103 RepID=A0A7W5Z3R8_9HYPH|nr:protein TolQ [Pseudochelatococcus contaminans]MBB3809056.1 biopolymer transport protein TolQ [Pseudochelatococcus contaminans]